MLNALLRALAEITGCIFIGDSLSDEQRKYNEYICGCFPFKWALHHSDYDNFTNGHTWAYMFGNVFNDILKDKATWSAQEKATYFKNVAEGGATTYDYRNIKSFFKHIKGFILSFFLGNIQKQAKKVKNILDPKTLGIIFAGANDLVTLGYYDEEGVARAVQGIINTIRILTNRNGKTGTKYLKHLLLVGLPDISETPRFENKSKKQKDAMQKACKQYNLKLQELANEYQYVDFDCCTIYQSKDKNYLDSEIIKNVEKAIIIVGEGKERTIYFKNNGEFIINKSNNELKKEVNVTLTKAQQAIFSEDGEIIRNEVNGNILDQFVNKVTKQAKLNIDIKMIGIEIILDEILQNPEAHGFTAGCAVYYLPENEGQESDLLSLGNITAGNAVIIKKADNRFFSYIIKDGQLIKNDSKPVLQKFDLSKETLDQLNEKIKKFPSESKIITLAYKDDIHNFWIINIIKSVVDHYKKSFNKEIILTSINNSVLGAIKKDYLNRNTIFWDDLHPARRLHELLAVKITEYIKANYLIKNQTQFKDDSTIGVKPKLNSDEFEESPGSLDSGPSLLYP